MIVKVSARRKDIYQRDGTSILAPQPEQTVPIEELSKAYLLVTSIPCYRDSTGARWLDQAWHHDLVEHLKYLPNFTLCAPLLPKNKERNLIRVENESLRYVDLPSQTSLRRALASLPQVLATLWLAVGRSEIVHSGVIGWPIPLGWIANPIAIARRKGLVVVVESSWRRDDGDGKQQTWKIRMLNSITERAARWSCARADVSLFTHSTYRDTLRCGFRRNSYVTPAVWVNEGDILEDDSAEESWCEKIVHPVRFLFAGRLVSSKGVDVLLAALGLLDDRGVKAQVDIIGQGDRLEACEQLAGTLRNAKVAVLDQVLYGAPFFELVRGYHALLLPSLSDEQPRVIFDANSQAVPIIASDTPGIRPHVEDDRTGWLIPRGDPELLARVMKRAMADVAQLHTMGMAALAETRGHTHTAMHRSRFYILKRHFASSN